MLIFTLGLVVILVILLWGCGLSSRFDDLINRWKFDNTSSSREYRVHGTVEKVSLPFQGFIRVRIYQYSLGKVGAKKKLTEEIDFDSRGLIPGEGSRIIAIVKPSRKFLGYNFGLRREVRRVIHWNYTRTELKDVAVMVTVG